MRGPGEGRGSGMPHHANCTESGVGQTRWCERPMQADMAVHIGRVCLELDMRNCDASALSKPWPLTRPQSPLLKNLDRCSTEALGKQYSNDGLLDPLVKLVHSKGKMAAMPRLTLCLPSTYNECSCVYGMNN